MSKSENTASVPNTRAFTVKGTLQKPDQYGDYRLRIGRRFVSHFCTSNFERATGMKLEPGTQVNVEVTLHSGNARRCRRHLY